MLVVEREPGEVDDARARIEAEDRFSGLQIVQLGAGLDGTRTVGGPIYFPEQLGDRQ